MNKSQIMKNAWTAAKRKFKQLSKPTSLNGWGTIKPVLRKLFAEALRNAWSWAKAQPVEAATVCYEIQALENVERLSLVQQDRLTELYRQRIATYQ